MAKPEERQKARELRKSGWKTSEIVKHLGVSKNSVLLWCRDIELTNEQVAELGAEDKRWRVQHEAAQKVKENARADREYYQALGREATQKGSLLHLMGAMLYWAEGGKQRQKIHFANTDPNMLKLFFRFLREELDIPLEDIHLEIHAHTQDKIEIERIKSYWLDLFGLPTSAISSYNYKQGTESRHARYENGICAIQVYRVAAIQHIYGAIQAYMDFENPDWLA